MSEVGKADNRQWSISAMVPAALLLLLTLAPIPFGSNRPWAWSTLALATSLLLAAWALAVAINHRPLVWRISLLVPTIAFAGVIGWIVFTLFPNKDLAHPVWQMASDALRQPLAGRIVLSVDAALEAMMRLLTYVSIFWLSLQHCRDRGFSDRLLMCMSWVGLILALYGLVNFFTGNPYLLWFQRWVAQDDVTATFVNRNHYATYAGLTLLCSSATSLSAFRANWRLSDRSQRLLARTIECLAGKPLTYLVISLVIGMAWLQTHSRMGAAAVVLGLMVMLILTTATRLIRGRIATWMIALLALSFLLEVSGETTLSRIAATTRETDRITIFSVVIDQIETAPFTGSGYGSFGQSFMMFRDLRLPSIAVFTEAHNSYLEMAAEIGIPATALLVLAIGWCASLCLLGAFRRQRGQIYPIVAVAASVIVGAHALTDFSIQIPAVAALYSALLGMGVAQSWSTEAASRPNQQDLQPTAHSH